MKMITFEDGVVKLGDEEVPGILRSLRGKGARTSAWAAA